MKELASSAVWNLLRFLIYMADLSRTAQKGQSRLSRSRRKAMTQEEIQELKQKVAVPTKPTRPFVFYQLTASGDAVQRKIILQGDRVFGAKQFFTLLAPAEYWNIHFADWVIKMKQATQFCMIYNADLAQQEIDNICLTVYNYKCFISTFPDLIEY